MQCFPCHVLSEVFAILVLAVLLASIIAVIVDIRAERARLARLPSVTVPKNQEETQP